MTQIQYAIWFVIIFAYCSAAETSSRTPKRMLEHRLGTQPKQPRNIDGLAGKCGKTPGSEKWAQRIDVFCGNEVEAQEQDELFASEGEFPFSVILDVRYRNMTANSTQDERCLGVLVHKDLVLTSGHCVRQGAIALRATAGLINEKTPPADLQQSFAWGYCRLRNRESMDADDDSNVALIQLRKPFNYNHRVQAACVATHKEPRADASCYLAGLMANPSNDTEGRGLMSVKMKKCDPQPMNMQGSRSGVCYSRQTNETNVNKYRNAVFEGSGLYCLSKCDTTPIVYMIAVNAKKIVVDLEKNAESIEVSRTYLMRLDTGRLLENCYEFVKE